jgi:hypothetical protein
MDEPLTEPIRSRCVTRKGSFVMPARLFEDGNERELAYFFATRMPMLAKPARREVLASGDVVQHWRITTVVRY